MANVYQSDDCVIVRSGVASGYESEGSCSCRIGGEAPPRSRRVCGLRPAVRRDNKAPLLLARLPAKGVRAAQSNRSRHKRREGSITSTAYEKHLATGTRRAKRTCNPLLRRVAPRPQEFRACTVASSARYSPALPTGPESERAYFWSQLRAPAGHDTHTSCRRPKRNGYVSFRS